MEAHDRGLRGLDDLRHCGVERRASGADGAPGPFELIVAAWQNGRATPPSGPYGLASLDLTPLNITF
jgi:hypothetical protein